jgi:hypothetical protein
LQLPQDNAHAITQLRAQSLRRMAMFHRFGFKIKLKIHGTGAAKPQKAGGMWLAATARV